METVKTAETVATHTLNSWNTIVYLRFGEFGELCAKFWDFWVNIRREIIGQSWLLLTPFSTFAIFSAIVNTMLVLCLHRSIISSLDKPARLIIRLSFGFVSDSETSATTPWERLQNLWWAIAQRKLAATQVSRLIIPPTYVEIQLDSLCQIWGKSQSA